MLFAVVASVLVISPGALPARGLGDGRAADIAYSEVTHHSAGIFLIVLAGVIAWESRRPRPFPWSAVSAPLWILLGLYLFVRSDAEAWPWGPKGFGEIFGDPQVLQHKVLTLIPMAIGLVEGLQRAGRLRDVDWRYIFPGLGLFGGASLFVHTHGGGLRLDAIDVQHAVMGLTSLGVGATLLFARRAEQTRLALAPVWPALIAVLGALLFFYTES